MTTVLIALTVVEVLVLVVVLAAYLIMIARTLRSIARTLGLVTFGVRAIEKHTEPLGNLVHDANESLREAARTVGVQPRTEAAWEHLSDESRVVSPTEAAER